MSNWTSALILLLFVTESVFSDDCGQRTALIQQLVSHGDRSRLGEWPWHAAILQRMNRSSPIYACGGTIITSNYILTTAHCTYHPSRVRPLTPSEIVVRTGISDLQQLEHSMQQMTVTKIIRHEDYHSTTADNDIALLKLTKELEFTDYVKPVCLWTDSAAEELITDKLGYIAGWGTDQSGEFSDHMKQVAMLIVSRKKCKESDPSYYTRYVFDGKSFCAGFQNGTSLHMGHSGGGLYIEIDGRWIQRGITNNGKLNWSRQLDTSSYLVFTDIAHFIPWINDKTGLNSDKQD